MEDVLEEAIRDLVAERPPLCRRDLERHVEALADTFGVARARAKAILERLMSLKHR